MTAQQNKQLGELNTALETNLRRSIELCVHTMQTFYPSLGNQARRVTELCRAMGQLAKLPPDDQRILESAALLHDIGLVGIPRHIIRRWQENPNSLAEPERTLIEQHPILGQELATFVSHLDKVGQIIRAHHERIDGHGYPDQLMGENIPWLARLLAVPVAFAACRLNDLDAIDRIKSGIDTAFDRDAVRIFLHAQDIATVPRRERQVTLSELRPGMVLAKGIFTPNGLLQRMQQNGSSCLRMRAGARAASKSIWGLSVMTCSGQVAWHSPHCTQASSTKRSIGRSGSSRNAPVGQAEAQDKQSVQPSTSTSTAPNGAPLGSGMMPTGFGAARCSSLSAKRNTLLLPPWGRKLAGRGTAGIDGIAHSASSKRSGSSVSMVSIRPLPKPSPVRIG